MSIHMRNSTRFMPPWSLGRRRVTALILLLGCAFNGAAPLQAANVDIANSPMASGTSIDVKPNIMFVLDNSGSMARTFIPDAAGTFANGAYGHASSACNALYFNPAITYTPPVDVNGNSMGNASFESAKKDGFDPSSPTVNLATEFQAYDSGCGVTGGGLCDTPQPAYYYVYARSNQDPEPLEYVYTSTGTLDTKKGIYPVCSAVPGKGGGKNPFGNPVIVGNSERQNFANWYSYYRTRINSMKTAAGKAFSRLPNPDGLRIGFSTHSETGVSESASFQPLDDFCAAGSLSCQQRGDIFEKLYGTTAISGVETPLRSSMAKIGRMYAGFDGSSRLTASQDPVQYSCQQNFLIMATDGSWNQDLSANFNIQNNAGVGDQDGDAPRPLYDHSKVSNTLADVAMYYYETDLRDKSLSNCSGSVSEQDVCENNVPNAGRDDALTQHMTTFTLGFGIDGSLRYADTYENRGSADFNAILDGSKNWPDPRPQDTAENFFRVDDLWHAAVNGRGTYYSAKTPDALIAGLTRAMGTAVARTGSGSGSATSNLEPVAGDNYAYVASYRTSRWDGDLQARTIDLISGALSTEQERVWSAKEKLDELIAAQGFAARKIYMKGSGATERLAFTSANVGSTHSSIRPTELTDAVVDFIRGDSSREDQPGNSTREFRDRAHAFGDVVSSHPVFVRRPPFKYTDSGYVGFAAAAAQLNRPGIVLVGANDGMLHAFNSETGGELWAYVPAAVIPNLHKLASPTYGQSAATPHQYYVDGVITVGDICVATNCATATADDWRTIAVVGLGKGGRSYFALDITNTATPQVLWEFSDENLGLAFGNPIITKRDGQWVVLLTSGYNNVSPGDGQGRLFVLNAKSGAKLTEIVTGSGTDPSESGIAKISNWVDNIRLDDTTRYVYGGDLTGRLWRFDLTANAGNGTAVELAALTGPDGDVQPITTRPEVSEVKTSNGSLERVVFVGTGKFLGVSDFSDSAVQSLYAVRETLGNTGWGSFRDDTGPQPAVEQELTVNGNTRTITNKAVDWTSSRGWWVDFDAVSGERIDIDFKLVNGVLTVVTNVPENGACVVGGTSYLYFFDNKTGSYVSTVEGSIVGRLLSQALGVGLSVIRVAGRDVAIVNTSDNRQISVPVPAYSASGSFRRLMWRELVN